MTTLPRCLKCQSEYVYQDDQLLICPECGYEWQADEISSNELVIRDSNGNSLADGDSVAIIKDLKLKGSSQVIKVGTKVKNIRLITGDHDIDCKIDGFGAIQLKSQFVKKV
ncbi:alkylphosphonate utilization protein [Francisella tularensis subsp. novicida]|uniref:zinc ribbon domain-containing protein YjdM n=1 Tax=Francisella tularensis TaxID=263 RepID=UPI000CE2B00B|nr:zinc ribbon domain-containing protein YjdM [Francisella tularensis]AVC44250.1 alkylphosphonate utilization protein [Francisella tularensis subsp. novicida]